MTSTKTRMAIISVAVIGLAVICGCGRGNVGKQNNQSQAAMAPTEWNNPATKLSPFTKVRYDGDTVIVTYNGAEYQLAAIDGVSTSDLLAFCRKNYGDIWQKRFAEDLVPVLNDMGHPINSQHTVSLTLIDPKTSQTTDIASADMTAENRQAVSAALSQSSAPSVSPSDAKSQP